MSNKNGLLEEQRQFLAHYLAGQRNLVVGELFAPKNRTGNMEEVARISVVNAVRTRTEKEGRVYSTSDENVRKVFRQTWQEFLHAAAIFYRYPVSEEEHIGRIESMCDLLTANHEEILEGKKMRFGITQMGLNVYLKYLWCLGEIPPPPHCPASDYTWTKSDSREDYDECISEYRESVKDDQATQNALQNGITSKEGAMSFWGLFEWKGND